jgi:preprotein translocase subunit SecD
MEQEYQQLQQDLQNSVNKMMDKISQKSLRPLQKQSYLSMASCLDNNQLSDQQINQCIQNAGRKPQVIQNMIQNEMNLFQSKIQRCSQVCQDDANHLVTNETKIDPNEIAKIEKVMFQCSKSCVEKHVAMLANLEAKILSEIARQG